MSAETLSYTPAAQPLTEPWISHACQFPADQQATLLPASMKRRHPWIGRRPEYSGYCVIASCECECHQAEAPAIPLINLEALNAP